MRNIVLKICLAFLFVATFGSIHAAVFRPVVSNFNTNDYGAEASQQNWDCSQNTDGIIYIANNNCLLRFDGYFWKQIALNGKSMIRSVLALGDRIYVGAFEEFGYFIRNEYGDYTYYSLASANATPSKAVLLSNEEPWVILENEGRVYFQTFSSIYVYDGKEVTKLELNGIQPLFIFKSGKDIYLQAIQGDFFRIDKDRLTKLFGREAVGNDDIVGVFPMYGNEQAMVMVSIQHGLFIYADGAAHRHRQPVGKGSGKQGLHDPQRNHCIRYDAEWRLWHLPSGRAALAFQHGKRTRRQCYPPTAL